MAQFLAQQLLHLKVVLCDTKKINVCKTAWILAVRWKSLVNFIKGQRHPPPAPPEQVCAHSHAKIIFEDTNSKCHGVTLIIKTCWPQPLLMVLSANNYSELCPAINFYLECKFLPSCLCSMIELFFNSSGVLFRSWLFCIQGFSCSVIFWVHAWRKFNEEHSILIHWEPNSF